MRNWVRIGTVVLGNGCIAPQTGAPEPLIADETTHEEPPQGSVPTVPAPSIGVETVPSECPEGRWPDLRIAEMVPGNTRGWRDITDDVVDFVELWDAAGLGLTLSGWTLSEGGQSGVLGDGLVAAGGRLLVAASGKADEPLGAPEGEIHLPFRLDSMGGTLSLLAPDGCVADTISWTRVPADMAVGRPDADPASWAFFLVPTPGGANTTESRPRFADPPTLLPASGVVPDAVVEVVVPSGTTVRGTLDGTEPSELSTQYTGAFAVEGGAFPVPVRVRSFEDGAWPSAIVTASVVEDDTMLDAGLRVVSLVVDPTDLFDDAEGIWAYGDAADYEPWYPYFGANFWEDWERPVHVDFYESDGTLLLSQDAGIAIHGGWSRAFDQRGLRLLARSAYGDPTFNIAAISTEELTEFTSLVLHNGGDWCGTHLFDASADVFLRDERGLKSEHLDSQGWEPVEVWLNGAYWGVYQLRERLNADFVAAHHPVNADDLDQLELGWTHAPHWQVEEGDAVAFDALEALIATTNLGSDDAAWASFVSQVDVENLALLLVATTWYANGDFGGNNLRLWRPREDEGAFRWMLYDIGHGWPDSATDTLSWVSTSNWPGMPAGEALGRKEFHDLVALVAAEQMATSFDPSESSSRLDEMGVRVQPAMADQMARWCPFGGGLAGWNASMAWARQFTVQRSPLYREQVRSALTLGPDVGLTVEVTPAGSGRIGLVSVEVAAPFSGLFFSNVPIVLTARPEPGWVFSGWVGDVEGDAATLTFVPTQTTLVQAVFVPE